MCCEDVRGSKTKSLSFLILEQVAIGPHSSSIKNKWRHLMYSFEIWLTYEKYFR